MRAVMKYCMRDDKTWDEFSQRYLVSGINCSGVDSIVEFEATKAAFQKMDGTNFYQYVQSFSPKENITPSQAHEIALEFATRAWPGTEVLVTTHCDTDHVHSHFVLNSVSFETGLKLRQSPNTLKELRMVSDQVCMAHGMGVLKPYDGGGSKLSAREWRAAQKGESWKFQLMYHIGESMKKSRSKEDFVTLMERKGYKMIWTDTRAQITFICPNGKKCRGNRLHHPKYEKGNFEHEFEIRERYTEQYVSGQADPGQWTGSGDTGAGPIPAGSLRDPGGMASGREGTAGAGSQVPTGAVPTDQAAGDTPAGGDYAGAAAGAAPGDQRPDDAGSQQDPATGWERERAEFFQSLHDAVRQPRRMAGDDGPVRDNALETTHLHRGGLSGPLRSGLYGLAALAGLMDDDEDPEEKRRRILAQEEAENFGAALGIVAGIAVAFTREEQEIMEQESCNEYCAEQELWQQTMGG